MTEQAAQQDFFDGGDGRAAAGLGEWEIDLSVESVRCSRRTESLLGSSQPSGIWSLSTLLDIFVAEDRPAVVDAIGTIRRGGAVEFQKRIRRHDDGSIRWLHVKGARVEGSGAQRILGVVTDVTDWRSQEDRRREAEKMEAIAHICGRIAHDYNNFLMAVGANLEMFEEQPPGSERAKRFYSAAHDGLQRGALYNQTLMGLSNRHDLDLRPVRADLLVSSLEDALRLELGELITLEINRSTGPLSCRTDPQQFEAALLHLASNARDAMPSGGKVSLSLSEQEVREAEASAAGVSPGQYLVVSVVDTGSGIDERAMERIFEPFFTTKAYRRAKGLGMSQVYMLTKNSGGFVSVRSELAQGTSVRLHLPKSS